MRVERERERENVDVNEGCFKLIIIVSHGYGTSATTSCQRWSLWVIRRVYFESGCYEGKVIALGSTFVGFNSQG